MAYTVPVNDTTYLAKCLKEYPDDKRLRAALNFILDVINKSPTEMKAASIATLKTALDTAIA